MAQLGLTEVHYIDRLVPEIAWIGYFLKHLGIKKGIETVVKFIETALNLKDWGKLPEFSLICTYRNLLADDWAELRKQLHDKDIFKECLGSLEPFLRCYPDGNPLADLPKKRIRKRASSKDVKTAREVVSGLFDRRSKHATIVQSVVLYVDIDSGKLKYSKNVPLPDLNSIFIDFGSDEAMRAGAHVRMHLNTVYGVSNGSMSHAWASYFWNRGKELAPLKTEIEIPANYNTSSKHPLVGFGIDYERFAWGMVDEIWTKLPVDIFQDEFFSVIGALLARQCNLAVKLAINSDLWDFQAGPLFLRPMTDCYITAAWILKDRIERARKFILYGLGQEKLQIEHLRSVLDEQEPERRNDLKQVIEAREAWLNGQRFSFLQNVDVGSWSGISTRDMADEAGCLDLYNFAYTPWSQAAHGVWNHIGRFDAMPSREPLHKHIWQPINFDHGREVDVVVNATKYFDKLCRLFVREFGLTIQRPSTFDWVMQRLNQLQTEMEQHKPPK